MNDRCTREAVSLAICFKSLLYNILLVIMIKVMVVLSQHLGFCLAGGARWRKEKRIHATQN